MDLLIFFGIFYGIGLLVAIIASRIIYKRLLVTGKKNICGWDTSTRGECVAAGIVAGVGWPLFVSLWILFLIGKSLSPVCRSIGEKITVAFTYGIDGKNK